MGKAVTAIVSALVAFGFAATLSVAVVFGEDFDDERIDDEPDHSLCTMEPAATTELDAERARIASIIIAEGQKAGVERRGLVVALAAAAVESRLRNLPYGDRDSLGVFQQRPSAGWGSPAQLMDPAYSAAAFFGGPGGPNATNGASEPPGLLDIPGWQSMPIGDAAQAVQRSAFPDRYAEFEDDARAWLAQLSGEGGTGCEASLPIREGDYRITDRFGFREHPITGEWKLHDGLDFAASAGTPVIAVAGGEVTFVGFRPWAGPHLVEVDHADGFSSSYGHMASADVTAGDTIAAGQQIGTVGNEGLSTGPHLHLTILDGTATAIDPEDWFAGYGVTP
ncbi:M23 family metallopeptidase [Phytoactinopolyspora halotolerans]|uniref:M23 family metallopeptidase n=1 Tax=Phytoactinopolyspora halotolerans TaxID=1981512 RepID=A0A6L9S7R3_9ACTN|nr:M23 family metallopeptidase [Phytoactinopolyspora halotolerans]NEE01206.1 M23 family metallopeptidase [Phytoactinopolyspora halotolerans]